MIAMRKRERSYSSMCWIYYFLISYSFVVAETHISRFADFENLSARNRDETIYSRRKSLYEISDYLATAVYRTRDPSLGSCPFYSRTPLLPPAPDLRRVSLCSFARTFAFQFAFTLLVPDKGWIMYSPTSEQTSMQPEWQISLPSEPGHESTSASTPLSVSAISSLLPL